MNSATSQMLAVVNCGELVTLQGPAQPRIRDQMKELSILRDGAMLVRSGVIEQVGSTAAIQAGLPAGCKVVDAQGLVVMPGFVDAHTHPVFAASRADEYVMRAGGATYQEIAAAGGGIRSTVRKTRASSEDELFDLALRRTQWFLRVGTTTIEAKSGYGLSLESELKMLRVIRRLNEHGHLRLVPTFLGAHETPDEFRTNPGEYVKMVIEEMLPAVARARLAEYCDVFCEPKYFSADAARRILSQQRERCGWAYEFMPTN